MAVVKFQLEAEEAKAVSAFLNVVRAQGKAVDGMKRIGHAGRQALSETERGADALRRKLEQAVAAAGRMAVARTQLATQGGGGGGLAMTAGMRAAAAAGGTSGYTLAAQDVSFARFLRARQLRDERAFRSFVAQREARLAASSALTAGVQDLVGRGIATVAEMRERRHARDLERVADDEAARRWRGGRAAEARRRVAEGAAYVGAAVAGLAVAAEQELQRYGDAIVEAEQSLSQLYGVGSNPARRGTLRAGAIGTSIASGLPLAQVGEMRGRMESAFEDIPGPAKRVAERAALQYGRLGARDVTSTAMGLGAAYQIYGRDLGGGERAMQTLANRLAYSADVGAFDPDSITPYLAMILGSFKGTGYTDVEALAGMALASKSGMRAETFATATRNISLLMMEGAARGKFRRTGSFVGDMRQVARMESPELLEMFGRDPFTTAKLMADNTDLLQRYVGELGGLGAGADYLGRKIGTAMATDPMAATARTVGSARALAANAPLMQMADPVIGRAIEAWEVRKAGAARELHPMFSWLAKPAVWMETYADNAPGSGLVMEPMQDRLLRAGARELINAARGEGDDFYADYLSLKYNPDRDLYFAGAGGSRTYAGEADAERLRELYREGYTGVSAGELMQFRQIQAAGGDAWGYLNRVGRGDAGAAAADNSAQLLKEAAAKLTAAAEQMGGNGPATAPARRSGPNPSFR